MSGYLSHDPRRFQSTLLCEERQYCNNPNPRVVTFQSTLLLRATLCKLSFINRILFQSTLLLRGATLLTLSRFSHEVTFQSTLLLRGATKRYRRQAARLSFSIHAPLARSDFTSLGLSTKAVSFQSTLLLRGATCRYKLDTDATKLFNPRSSCEERPELRQGKIKLFVFNPRSSLRGATCPPNTSHNHSFFNPRSLARSDTSCPMSQIGSCFQSTLLLRGATGNRI